MLGIMRRNIFRILFYGGLHPFFPVLRIGIPVHRLFRNGQRIRIVVKRIETRFRIFLVFQIMDVEKRICIRIEFHILGSYGFYGFRLGFHTLAGRCLLLHLPALHFLHFLLSLQFGLFRLSDDATLFIIGTFFLKQPFYGVAHADHHEDGDKDD